MADDPTALFVTASGTEIGKTHVAEAVIRSWRAAGHGVRALKPVASGFDPRDPGASDAGRLLAALGLPPTPANVARVSPWRFSAALSPDMAARREGRTVPYREVLAFCRDAVREAGSSGGRLLVEGIGGVMVPLDDSRTVLDLIADLGLPVLLVGGSYLGGLSHALTAFEVLRARGVAVARVVVSETPGSAVPLPECRDVLRRFVGATPVEAMPFRRRAP